MQKSGVLIHWDQSNYLGIPVIDDQHHGIVSTINSLHYFLNQKDSNGDYYLTTTIAMINSYIKMHFATEEHLFKLSGYPDAEHHRMLHENLIKQYFEMAHESLLLHSPATFLDFLKSWWEHHTSEEDREYVDHLRAYLKLDQKAGSHEHHS